MADGDNPCIERPSSPHIEKVVQSHFSSAGGHPRGRRGCPGHWCGSTMSSEGVTKRTWPAKATGGAALCSMCASCGVAETSLSVDLGDMGHHTIFFLCFILVCTLHQFMLINIQKYMKE